MYSIVQKISIEETDHILLDGLSESDIEREKTKLIKKHIKKVVKQLKYPVSDSVVEICSSRLFFVCYNNYLVLCGVYHVSAKLDAIGEYTSIRHEIYDYLLFCEKEGFYLIKGCSEPLCRKDTMKCISPSIYLKSTSCDTGKLLKYGETYASELFHKIYFLHNIVTNISDVEKRTNITVFENTTITNQIEGATLFSDLSETNGYFLYTKELDHMGWLVTSNLVNCYSGDTIDFLCQGGYAFPYNSEYTLACIMPYADNVKFRISDRDNYYFYISQNETFAFSEIMKCVEKYGAAVRMKNLFIEDPSINYQLCFSRKVKKDIINFVYGVISKSKVVYPVIFGCPIHDVVEVLCRDSKNNPYLFPQHSIDEISAQNIIDYIRHKFGGISNGEIVRLLVNNYGSYSTIERNQKRWVYFHAESLRCEYLPISVEDIVNDNINGQYVKKLESNTLSVKWKSEFLLYRLIYSYFPDAIIHYHASWLGLQHLDIFIPSLSLGVEYQGTQHYKMNDFFGGEFGFENRQFLDEQKRKICKENDVILIEWPYTLTITPINFIKLLQDCGITDIPEPNPFDLPVETEESIPEEKTAIQICQFSLSGELINRYSSYEEAATDCGITPTSISKAVNGYSKTAGGSQWRRFLANETVENIEPLKKAETTNKSKPIYQVSFDGEILEEFESIGKAEKITGINRKSIRSVLNGIQKQAGGYFWAFKN